MSEVDLQLDLPRFQTEIQIKQEAGKRWIWGVIRSKWLVLQPEELVRQLLLQYLMLEIGVNKNRIAVERGLSVNGLQKRCDILIYDLEFHIIGGYLAKCSLIEP
ncbi:MAG: type I restriction enzyme HsdR N-terminal domain-containing protein, partial [Bacteroidota bacterium]